MGLESVMGKAAKGALIVDDIFEERAVETFSSLPILVQEIHFCYYQQDINAEKVPRPPKGSVDDFLAFNSGNLFNGYCYSVLADILLTYMIDKMYNLSSKYLSENNPIVEGIDYVRQSPHRINLLSGALGSAAICFFELTSIFNHGGIDDIPAGLVGSLLKIGVRYADLKYNERKNKITYSER